MSILSQWLGGLWKDIEAPFVSAIQGVEAAFESKDATAVVNSVSSLITVGAVAAENLATQTQAAGTTLTGPDKKAAVTNAVNSVVGPQIAQLQIPGVQSSVAQNFFTKLLDGLISVGIDAAVAKLNKSGWKL